VEDVKTPQSKRAFRRKRQLERDLAHVNEEIYRRNMELAETNKTLSLLRKIDALVLASHDSLKVLSNQITDAIAATTEYPLVALLAPSSSRKSDLEVFGLTVGGTITQLPLDQARKFRISTDQEWFHSTETSVIFNFKDVTIKQLTEGLQCTPSEAKQLHQLPIYSVYIVKLTARERLVGALVIGLGQPTQQMHDNDKELFNRLSEAVGVALDNKLLFEENQRVVNQLQRTNEKLKALDEAKDEFISMASHQLRTPLTSVKGYMSMVIDGDAGKLSRQQHKLLDQAFISSQRMVYLIADLLNVSRLKTGKFVIEPTPANLADIVEGEISQLVETAKSRGLELSYKKPKDFPLIMLDETKIRQVIMNFVDNAIYYTPSGGHIKVEVKDKSGSIEFTVTDDGLGVPKEEQPHLFTKFYRAGNAKKARPDGTGLGLFMAKKVVIAQGGALIFKSREGKGSTFGFTFSKDKLKVPKNTPVKPDPKQI
jgi:signal transduction histidine kinase